MLKVLSSILCDLDPKVKALGQKAGICDGVPSTSALVLICFVSSPEPAIVIVGCPSCVVCLQELLQRTSPPKLLAGF